jgi:DNA-binding CsgD family transcriptional regulator
MAATVAASVDRLARTNADLSCLAAASAHIHGLLQQDPVALKRAVDLYRHPWARGSAAEDAGVALADTERDSRAQLDRARCAYEQAGAARDAERVRTRLRDAGTRRRHRSRAERPTFGWASLTDTEHRVALVVAEGLTNAEAADRMFLSRHTVDFHLRQVFRKLDISSRVELARRVVAQEAGLLTYDS